MRCHQILSLVKHSISPCFPSFFTQILRKLQRFIIKMGIFKSVNQVQYFSFCFFISSSFKISLHSFRVFSIFSKSIPILIERFADTFLRIQIFASKRKLFTCGEAFSFFFKGFRPCIMRFLNAFPCLARRIRILICRNRFFKSPSLKQLISSLKTHILHPVSTVQIISSQIKQDTGMFIISLFDQSCCLLILSLLNQKSACLAFICLFKSCLGLSPHTFVHQLKCKNVIRFKNAGSTVSIFSQLSKQGACFLSSPFLFKLSCSPIGRLLASILTVQQIMECSKCIPCPEIIAINQQIHCIEISLFKGFSPLRRLTQCIFIVGSLNVLLGFRFLSKLKMTCLPKCISIFIDKGWIQQFQRTPGITGLIFFLRQGQKFILILFVALRGKYSVQHACSFHITALKRCICKSRNLGFNMSLFSAPVTEHRLINCLSLFTAAFSNQFRSRIQIVAHDFGRNCEVAFRTVKERSMCTIHHSCLFILTCFLHLKCTQVCGIVGCVFKITERIKLSRFFQMIAVEIGQNS